MIRLGAQKPTTVRDRLLLALGVVCERREQPALELAKLIRLAVRIRGEFFELVLGATQPRDAGVITLDQQPRNGDRPRWEAMVESGRGNSAQVVPHRPRLTNA